MTQIDSYRAPIVVLFGPIGSGKTTTANELIAQYRFNRVSFADALRREVAQMLLDTGMAPDDDLLSLIAQMVDPETKEKFRPLLQWWGKYRRDNFSIDYWLDRLVSRATREAAQGARMVVDDCRYKNEYLALKRHGAVFFRLQENPRTQTIATDHESERDWPTFSQDLTLPWAPVMERANTILGRLRVLDLTE